MSEHQYLYCKNGLNEGKTQGNCYEAVQSAALLQDFLQQWQNTLV